MGRFDASLITKIIIAFLIAVMTLLVSKRITEVSLKKTMEPISKLSETDPQSKLINELFKDIVRLDYEQRMYIGETSNKNFLDYINSSKEVIFKLDSLKFLSSDIPIQLDRIERMKSILQDRNNLFFQYLNLRKQFDKNNALDEQIQQLSDFVTYFSIRGDSSIYSTTTRIHHSKSEQEVPDTTPVKRNLVSRVLGIQRKAPPKKEISHYVLEQSETIVDTQALQEEDSIITQFTSTISDIERIRKIQLENINVKHREFEKANNNLIRELLDILDKIENETLIKKYESNLQVREIIDEGLNTTSRILITFIVLTSVLAVFIFTDIAKSNRYKKELIIAKENAETLSHAKQQFLANMSHELRTPLQSIVGYAELMSGDSQQINPHNIMAVRQSSQHLLHVVNQVLDYSSIVSNGIQLEKKPFDIKNLLNEVYKIIYIQAKNKNLSFSSNIHEIPSHYIKGDAFRLKQILLNLLNNAVKFTPDGQVDFIVRQHMGKNATKYEFIIKDTGIGIEEKNRERIFEEFEQLNESDINGNGLGLNIVRKIVARMDGNISLLSRPGEGSTFTVELIFEQSKESVASSELPASSAGKQVSTQLVWIIDDDELILELCHQYLMKNKIYHKTFSSSGQVVNIEFPEELTLVMMDIRMPEVTGYQLVNILKEKASKEGRDIKFIAVTAQVFQEERDKILDSGFDDILHKPFLEQDIMNMIAHYFSLERGSERFEERPEEDADIIELFKNETRKDRDALLLAIDQAAVPDILHYSHKLAGRLAQMNYSEESRKFRIVEILIRSGKGYADELKEAVSALQNSLL